MELSDKTISIPQDCIEMSRLKLYELIDKYSMALTACKKHIIVLEKERLELNDSLAILTKYRR